MPHRLVPQRLLDRLGRRGACLVLFGIAWLTQGAFLLGQGPHPASHTGVFVLDLPWPAQSIIWAISGILAIVFGFRQKDDHPGWMGGVAGPLIYSCSYLVAGVTYATTSGAHGSATGPFGFIAWGALALLMGVISSWPEAPAGDGDE